MQSIVAIAVGCCWGVTNTLLELGVRRAGCKLKAGGRHGTCQTTSTWLARVIGQHWASLLTSPGFVVAQLLNWLASATLVLSLADGKLHLATVANAISVAVTAASGRVLAHEKTNELLLCSGVACIAIGVYLTSL